MYFTNYYKISTKMFRLNSVKLTNCRNQMSKHIVLELISPDKLVEVRREQLVLSSILAFQFPFGTRPHVLDLLCVHSGIVGIHNAFFMYHHIMQVLWSYVDCISNEICQCLARMHLAYSYCHALGTLIRYAEAPNLLKTLLLFRSCRLTEEVSLNDIHYLR